MYKIFVLSYVILLASVNLVYAGTLTDEKAIQSFTDQVMAKASTGDLITAFNLMKPYAIVSTTEIDGAALQSKAQMDQFGARVGLPIGYEFFDSKKAGNNLLRLRYIERCEKAPLEWSFYFYKNNQGWVLTDFYWSDKGVKGLFSNE